MTPGFQNKTLDVRTGDGLEDILLEALVFHCLDGRILRAPIGGTTDGLSVPRCVQNIIPATGGDWFSGVLHDSGYRNQLQILSSDGTWELANLTQQECDDLILEAMTSQGVSFITRHTVYRALRMFGSRAFNEDRALAA